MEYEFISDDEMEQMLTNRLRQYEQEHYNHVVNLAALEASGLTDTQTKQQINESKKALDIIERAHRSTKTERAKVKARIDAKPKDEAEDTTPAPSGPPASPGRPTP